MSPASDKFEFGIQFEIEQLNVTTSSTFNVIRSVRLRCIILPAKAKKEEVCFYRRWFVCLCVCLIVTTITKKIVDGFVPNFMGRFPGEREDQVLVSLGPVEGCGSNCQKNSVNRRLFTFYTSTSRCGKCCQLFIGDKKPQISLSRGVVLSQSTFHLVRPTVCVLLNFRQCFI